MTNDELEAIKERGCSYWGRSTLQAAADFEDLVAEVERLHTEDSARVPEQRNP